MADLIFRGTEQFCCSAWQLGHGYGWQTDTAGRLGVRQVGAFGCGCGGEVGWPVALPLMAVIVASVAVVVGG